MIDITKPVKTVKGDPVLFLRKHQMKDSGDTVLIGNIDDGNPVSALRLLQFTWDLNGKMINIRPGFVAWDIENVEE